MYMCQKELFKTEQKRLIIAEIGDDNHDCEYLLINMPVIVSWFATLWSIFF